MPAFAASSGSFRGLPLDARQTEELILTSAQSLLAAVLILELVFGRGRSGVVSNPELAQPVSGFGGVGDGHILKVGVLAQKRLERGIPLAVVQGVVLVQPSPTAGAARQEERHQCDLGHPFHAIIPISTAGP